MIYRRKKDTTKHRAIAVTVFLLCCVSTMRIVFAQGIPVFDASNVANTLLTAQRSLEQINNQLKMIEGLDFDASEDLARVLNETLTVLNQVEGVTYDMDQVSEQLASTYPEDMSDTTYDELTTLKESVLTQTRDAQKHAMALQASIAGTMPQTQGTVNDLVARSNAAPGTTAAIQANTQLLAILSGQITQMQALLMAQTRALNTYIQEQNTASSIAARQREVLRVGLKEEAEVRTDGYDPLAY